MVTQIIEILRRSQPTAKIAWSGTGDHGTLFVKMPGQLEHAYTFAALPDDISLSAEEIAETILNAL